MHQRNHRRADAEVVGPVAGLTFGRGVPVTPDRIRMRAYEIFLDRQRGLKAGDATSDWLQAERELTTRPSEPGEERGRSRGEVLLAGRD